MERIQQIYNLPLLTDPKQVGLTSWREVYALLDKEYPEAKIAERLRLKSDTYFAIGHHGNMRIVACFYLCSKVIEEEKEILFAEAELVLLLESLHLIGPNLEAAITAREKIYKLLNRQQR